MSLLILTFFAVYGGMHVYAFFRARHALALGAWPAAGVAGFMLLMVLAPFLIRVLERNDYDLPARSLSSAAYLWMAGIFLFFCASLVLEAINLVLRGAGWAAGAPGPAFIIPARIFFFAAAGLAFGITLYGYVSAQTIRTERLRIETAKLPAGIDRLKIVQISDVHLGLIIREERLKKILTIVEAEKPDVFVSTGDLVDAQINSMQGLAALLRNVQAPHGKFAVTGNHEYYAGINEALKFTRDSGFRLLRREAVQDNAITIAGVDDPAGAEFKIDKPEPEAALLAGLPKDKFILLLKHRPLVDARASALFDLQLSGHTHKGQIYPFTYIVEIAYPLIAGKFDLPGGSILRVSRGTGTWGPPVRVLSPPEVTVVELVRRAR